jgi:hypothetical protein
MRTLTTNWNASSFYNETVFVDRASGNTMTVGANSPVRVRTMFDSVQSGAYKIDADSIDADPATLSTEPDDEDTVTVTVEVDGDVAAGYPVKAATDDAGVATVSPLLAHTKEDGTAVFTITSVADGEATITFYAGTETDTTVVTVTES